MRDLLKLLNPDENDIPLTPDDIINEVSRHNTAIPHQSCAFNYMTDAELDAAQQCYTSYKSGHIEIFKNAFNENSDEFVMSNDNFITILNNGCIRQAFNYINDINTLVADFNDLCIKYADTHFIYLFWAGYTEWTVDNNLKSDDGFDTLTPDNVRLIIRHYIDYAISDFCLSLIKHLSIKKYDEIQALIDTFTEKCTAAYIENNMQFIGLDLDSFTDAYNLSLEIPAEPETEQFLSLQHIRLNTLFVNHSILKTGFTDRTYKASTKRYNRIAPAMQYLKQGQRAWLPCGKDENGQDLLVGVLYDLENKRTVKEEYYDLTQDYFLLIDIIYSYTREHEDDVKHYNAAGVVIYLKDIMHEQGYERITKQGMNNLKDLISICRQIIFEIDTSTLRDYNPDWLKNILAEKHIFINEKIVKQVVWRQYMLDCSPIQTDANGDEYIIVKRGSAPITSVFADRIKQIKALPTDRLSIANIKNLSQEQRIIAEYLKSRILLTSVKKTNSYYKVTYGAICNQKGVKEFNERSTEQKSRLRDYVDKILNAWKKNCDICDYERYSVKGSRTDTGVIIYTDHLSCLRIKYHLNKEQVAAVTKIIRNKSFVDKVVNEVDTLTRADAEQIQRFYKHRKGR